MWGRGAGGKGGRVRDEDRTKDNESHNDDKRGEKEQQLNKEYVKEHEWGRRRPVRPQKRVSREIRAKELR
jgi:hypothetical protein